MTPSRRCPSRGRDHLLQLGGRHTVLTGRTALTATLSTKLDQDYVEVEPSSRSHAIARLASLACFPMATGVTPRMHRGSPHPLVSDHWEALQSNSKSDHLPDPEPLRNQHLLRPSLAARPLMPRACLPRLEHRGRWQLTFQILSQESVGGGEHQGKPISHRLGHRLVSPKPRRDESWEVRVV